MKRQYNTKCHDFKKVKKYCLTCGNLLKLYAARDIERAKYCSVLCKDKGHKIAMKGHKVSGETRKKMSVSAKKQGFGKASGVGHPNWKGGTGTENNKIRTSIEYVNWRKAVYQRDGWTCQQCGQVGGGLNAHHILSFSKYPLLRFKINNGITLCELCHNQLHGRNYKRKENKCG